MTINFIHATADEQRFVSSLLDDPRFQNAYSGPVTVEAMRAANAGFVNSELAKRMRANVTIEPLTLGGVPCEKLTAVGNADDKRVLMFLHGGGFVRGSLDMGRATAAELAKATRLPVIAVGYRQAPEHPFPAANEDTLKVYLSFLQSGYDPKRIAVVGESAGGALALTLPAWLARENAGVPCALAGISPMIDYRMRGAAWEFNAKRDLADRAMGRRMTDHYIDQDRSDDPLASPLTTCISLDTAILLCVGSSEVMLSDVERFAHRADAASSDVTLNLYEMMPHGFTRFDLQIARQAVTDAAAWCLSHLATAAVV